MDYLRERIGKDAFGLVLEYHDPVKHPQKERQKIINNVFYRTTQYLCFPWWVEILQDIDFIVCEEQKHPSSRDVYKMAKISIRDKGVKN